MRFSPGLNSWEAISVAMWVFGRMKGDEASFKRFEGTLHQRADAFERTRFSWLCGITGIRAACSIIGLFKDDRIDTTAQWGSVGSNRALRNP